MDWVKLAQDYFLDPRIRGLTGDVADAAELMFVRGLARAGRVGRAGFIPEQDVELLTRRRRYEVVVDALLRSGLWTRATGGYQVTRWSDWQDHLDALTRKRTADRERQRRRRAATREDTQASTLSRETSRDVTAVEGEGDLEGVQLGDQAHGTQPSTTSPPPVETGKTNGSRPSRYCPRHPTGTSEPCGPCKDARLAAEAWERDQAQQRAQRDSAARAGPKCPTCGNATTSTYHQRVCTRTETTTRQVEP